MHEALPDLLLRHRAAKPLALAVNVALAALILVLVARLVWLVLGAGADVAPARVPSAAPAPATPAESLSRWHLFGNAAPRIDPRALASAPDTQLDLKLRGIFALDDPKAGHAIIADAAGAEATYRVGAELPGGATVDGVYPDRVTLSRGGVLETLRLPNPEERTAAAAPRPGNAANRGLGVAPANAPLPAIAPGGPVVAPNVDWDAATQKLGVDARALAQQVQVLPVVENGKFVGVRLSGGREAAALAKLGLKPDDVVTQVNGIPLDSFSRAQTVASSFQNASTVSVTVRRGGRTEELSVSLR